MVTRPLLVLLLRTYEITAGSNTISEVHSFAFPTETSIYLFTFDQVIAISPSHSTAEVPVWCVEATFYLWQRFIFVARCKFSKVYTSSLSPLTSCLDDCKAIHRHKVIDCSHRYVCIRHYINELDNQYIFFLYCPWYFKLSFGRRFKIIRRIFFVWQTDISFYSTTAFLFNVSKLYGNIIGTQSKV